MEHIERNIKVLHDRRIFYRNNLENYESSVEFDWGWYFENGTRDVYVLFSHKGKINTYKSFKWHLYVLWYLNPQLSLESFNDLVKELSKKSNGFVTFEISASTIKRMVNDVYLMDLDRPPPNKLRKFIFKEGTGLSKIDKLKIVGQFSGRSKINSSDIYEAMLLLHDDNKKITTTSLSGVLNVSNRTIYRNLNEDLKKEKALLNAQLKTVKLN